MKMTKEQLKKIIKEEIESIKSASDLRTQLMSRLRDSSFLKGWDGAEATAALQLFDMLNSLSLEGSKGAIMNRIIDRARMIVGGKEQKPEKQSMNDLQK